MSKGSENHAKIEAGQILHPDCFPGPNELVCIEVKKVFDQVSVRDCEEVTFTLDQARKCEATNVTVDRVYDFDITKINVLSKSDSLVKAGFKKLVLKVRVCFKVDYSFDFGYTRQTVIGEEECVDFNIIVNEIFCPDCLTQIGVTRFPHEGHTLKDKDGTFIKAEAIIEAFNIMVAQPGSTWHHRQADAAMVTLQVGAFFVIKCECEVQLLIPAYGYCPVPPEQQNPAELNCTIFNNRELTPFPRQFFPNQKVNPLDSHKREDWDD